METNKIQKLSFLMLRMMGSFIFIAAGFNHLLQTAGPAARLQKASFGHLALQIAPAETLVILSGVGLLLGGLMLLLGYKTQLAALGLLAILVPITLTVQIDNPTGMGPLFKNVALGGMLLFFIVNGASFYGLDQFLDEKSNRKITPVKAGRFVALLATGMVFILGSCTASASVAQATSLQGNETAVARQKYAVLISQPNHLKAAVNTAETIARESRYNSDAFVVMACGKSVEAFKKGSELTQEIEKGRSAGVVYRICGMSLKKFKIEPGMLVEGVEVVPNGLTHMFDLELQGYLTVEL